MKVQKQIVTIQEVDHTHHITPTKKLITRSRTPGNVVSNSRSATALLQRALVVEPSKHVMNTSKSKQMFSFGVGPRFKPMSIT